MGIDIKPGATLVSDFFNGLDYWRERLGSPPVVCQAKTKQFKSVTLVTHNKLY